MLTVLFSWVVICAASLLFGKAIVDSVYKNRLETMGRPDVYIVTGILFLNVYAQFFSLFYKVAGIACTILGAAGMILFFIWLYRRFYRKKDIRLFPGPQAVTAPCGPEALAGRARSGHESDGSDNCAGTRLGNRPRT